MKSELPTLEQVLSELSSIARGENIKPSFSIDVAYAYANGELVPVQSMLNEGDLLKMMPPERKVDCLCVDPFTSDPESVPCDCGARENLTFNKHRQEIAHAISGKLAKSVVDREKLILLLKVHFYDKDYFYEQIADELIKELGGGHV